MDKSKIVSCKKLIAGKEISLETGKVARQATASVIASSGDTQVLVTVVAGAQKEGQNFFPLTVNYMKFFKPKLFCYILHFEIFIESLLL